MSAPRCVCATVKLPPTVDAAASLDLAIQHAARCRIALEAASFAFGKAVAELDFAVLAIEDARTLLPTQELQ